MNSYFIFYDVIREAPEFEYDRSSEVTYAKIKMSLYKTEDKKHIKIAENIEQVELSKIINKDYMKKIKMTAENDDAAILLFYLNGGDIHGRYE